MLKFLFGVIAIIAVTLGHAYPAYAQEKIAFASDRNGNYEIYIIEPDGSNVQRITTLAGDDIQPSWSPDGKSLVFCSNRDGDWEIYTMRSDGSGTRRLTNNAVSDRGPVWSPDGRSIAFHSYRDGNWEIYVMKRDGSNQRNITNSSATETYPSWSPDSRYITYHYYNWQAGDDNWEIYKIQANGTSRTALTTTSPGDLYPSWSPDGQSIAFWSDRDGDWNIYLMTSSGGNQKKISASPPFPAVMSRVAWSADSRYILFPSTDDIHRMRKDGSDHRNLTISSSNDIYPAWAMVRPSNILTIVGPLLSAVIAQSNGGLGPCPTNFAPFLGKVIATRTTLSFGRNDGRWYGVDSLPGFTSAFFALIAPQRITLDGNQDGKYDGLDPIVLAGADLPSYTTLLVAEGAIDADGDPLLYRWGTPRGGTYYSTGSAGSSFEAGEKITDLSLYNRNSIIWEPTSLLFPVLDHTLMGGSSSVGLLIEDDPTDRNRASCQTLSKKKSPFRYSSLNYGNIVHLELAVLNQETIPYTHPDPDYRGGVEVNFFAQIKGNYEAATETTFRVSCGNDDDTIFDQSGGASGGVLQCQYKRNEVGDMVRITTVGSSYGFRNSSNPYVHRVSDIPFIMETYYSRGGTIGDTLTTTLYPDTGELYVQLWDSGSLKDDAFELYIDGSYIGATPPGASNLFSIENLASGSHQMSIVVKLAPDNIGTYTARLFGGASFSDGTDTKTGYPKEGVTVKLDFTIP